MKFLHTSDLHLGKRLGDIPLLEDQQDMLNQIVDIARDEHVDGVLIAGDVYQQSAPQAEAMEMFSFFLEQLKDAGISVYLISGNHDNDMRISYFGGLIRQSGVFVSEQFHGKLQSYTLEDAYGRLHIHLLPFFRPRQVQCCYPEEEITSYPSALQAILDHSEICPEDRNILVCHQFLTGAETTGDEERTVGGVDDIPGSLVEGFDYVALGHIHGAQRVGKDTIRYSGSPLKYSLSEARHKKSVSIVELKEKGDVAVRLVPIHALRDVREVEGTLTQILSQEVCADLVRVTLLDEDVAPDARLSVATVFPNMIKFAVRNSSSSMEMDVTNEENLEQISVEQLFREFYGKQNEMEPSEKQMELFIKVWNELEDEK